MDPLLELNPLKPEEMLEAYKMIVGSYTPFDEQSLSLMAQLSRGIFRRFMRYIRLTVADMLLKGKGIVSVDDVKTIINDDVLMKDAELEFMEMFRNEAHKQQATKTLSFLREQKEANQKTIAEALGFAEAAVSRLVNTLEDHGYVRRHRGEHGEWLVSAD